MTPTRPNIILIITDQQQETYRTRADYGNRTGAFEWNLPEETHSDMFVGDLAAWWIDAKPQTRPLFLQIGLPGPHPPYDPVPRHLTPYLHKDLPLPTVSDEGLRGQPSAQKELIEHNTRVDHDSIVWTKSPSREQLHTLRAHYSANVTMIDEKVGEFLDALQRRGYLDNSIVVFTSDHGDCLGDHGNIQK